MVGKSDFNENPVVSLDLDLDFGLRLRVCQKKFDEEIADYRYTVLGQGITPASDIFNCLTHGDL